MIDKYDEKIRECTNCKWTQKAQLADPQGKPIIGEFQYTCHRFPPSALMVPGPNNTFQLASAFPAVTDGMVCSLHEPQGTEDTDTVLSLVPSN